MSESPVGSQAEELDRQIASTVTRVVRELQEKLGERIRETSKEMLGRLEGELEIDIPKSFAELADSLSPSPPAGTAEELLAAVGRLDGEATQADVLNALVEEARRFASRTAFFLIRVGEIRGWGSEGWNGDWKELRFDVPGEGAWAELARGAGAVHLDADGCQDLAGRLDAEAGDAGILVPFVIRGQLAGTLYADRIGEAGKPDFASLQLLTHAAAQSLETVSFRGHGASPALRGSTEEAEGIPLWTPPEGEGEADVDEAPAAAIEESEAPPVSEEAGEIEPAAEPEAADAGSEEPPPATEPMAFVAPEMPPAFEEPAASDAAEEMAVETEEAVPEMPAAEPAEEPAFVELVEPPDGAVAEPAAFVEPLDTPPEPAVEPEYVEPLDLGEPAPPETVAEDVFETQTAAEPVGGADIWEDEDDEPTVIGQKTIETSPAPDAPDVPSVLSDAVGQQTVRLDISQLPGQPPAPEPQFELEPEAPAGFELEVEPAPLADMAPTQVQPPEDMAPTQVRPPEDMAPTQVQPPEDMAPTQVQPPEEIQPVADVGHPPSFATPPPATPPPDPGGTQVSPPDDLVGPGSAFAQTSPPAAESGIPSGEEALHEEARRLARLLVSEIKLYNEEVIEEGRMAGNIYSRLKEDIDRSRQMYSERIDPRIKEDYFYQELVQRLAGGDPKLLGM